MPKTKFQNYKFQIIKYGKSAVTEVKIPKNSYLLSRKLTSMNFQRFET